MKKRRFNRTIAMLLVFCMVVLMLPVMLVTPAKADVPPAATSALAGAQGVTDWMGIMGKGASAIGTLGSAASAIYMGLNMFGIVKDKDDIEIAKLNQIIDTLSTMQKQLDKIEGKLDDVATSISGLTNAVTVTGFNQVFSNVNTQINSARNLPDDYNNIVGDFDAGMADGSIDPASGISNYDTDTPTFDPTSAGLGGDAYMVAAGDTTDDRQLLAFRLSGADAKGEDYSGNDYIEFRVASHTSGSWTPVGESGNPLKLCDISGLSATANCKYRIHLGHIQWTTRLSNTTEGSWSTYNYGIVNDLNELNFQQHNLDTTPPFRPTVDAEKPYAYQSVSQVEALRGYFENGKHINKYTGKLETSSTRLVTSYGNDAGSLQTNVISFVNLISNNNLFSQTSGTTLFQYLDYYYAYLNMPYEDTLDSHGNITAYGSYSARKQARDLINLIVMDGLGIDNLYVHYMWMTNNYNNTSFITARTNISNAWNKIGAVNANDVFQLELNAKITDANSHKYALFRGTIASVGLTDMAGVRKTYEAVTSCANTENSIIVMPVIWDNQPINGIADNVFKNKTNIKGIILPKTLTFIGKDAFSGCTGLTNTLEIPALTNVGMHPFCDVPASITYKGAKILDYLFAYARLTSFDVSLNTTEIGKCAFFGTYYLRTVNIPPSVTKIGDYAFCNSTAGTVNIYGNPAIGDYAFGFSIVVSYDTQRITSYGDWFDSHGNLYGSYYITEYPYENYYDRDIPITSWNMEHEGNHYYRAAMTTNSLLIYIDLKHGPYSDPPVYSAYPEYPYQTSTLLNCAADATNVIAYKDRRFDYKYFSNAAFWGIGNWTFAEFKGRETKDKPSVTIGTLALPKAVYENSLKPAAVSMSADTDNNVAVVEQFFDGSLGTYHYYTNDASIFLSYDEPFILRSYTLVSSLIAEPRGGGYDALNPISWTVYGSNNKSTWTRLSNVDNSSNEKLPAINNVLSSFNVSNNWTAYRYYKFAFIKGAYQFRMSEMMLFDDLTSGNTGYTFKGDGSVFSSSPYLSDFTPAEGGNISGPLSPDLTFPYLPVIDPEGGSLTKSQRITIYNPNDDEYTVNEAVYYTLDGSPVTEESRLYTGPFTLKRSATVTAAVYDSVYRWSAPASFYFTVIDHSGDDGTPSAPSSPTAPAQTQYSADVAGGSGAGTALPIMVDAEKRTASVDIGSQGLGQGGTVVTIPSIPDVDAYSVGIPVADLSAAGGQGTLTFNTDYGSVTIPPNMLAGLSGISGSKAEITVGQGDKDSLPEDVKDAIGDRPLIQLTLSVDGSQTDWSNPGTPVTVSIPYTPAAEELANPESIVIWYIDGSGKPQCVTNGHYDAATGKVAFTTTHFSLYAVAYNKVSFNDVAADAWYSKAVNFIAAREITGGTGGGNYSPNAKLTRGDFLVLMMKAYGIAPDANPADNFSDAGDTYYTGYLAAAKRLGISGGVGDNMFAPKNNITRQEMFTLLYNALKVIGQLPGTHGRAGGEAADQPERNGTGAVPYSRTLADFSDAGQIASWAEDAMALFVETGTVSGSNSALNPKGTTTRAEMAQVLYNLLSGN